MEDNLLTTEQLLLLGNLTYLEDDKEGGTALQSMIVLKDNRENPE